MARQQNQGQNKKSGGGKQDKKKTDKTRHPNPNGAMQTFKNAKRRKTTDARRTMALMTRLLARGEKGLPGGIKTDSIRHKRLLVRIKDLQGVTPSTGREAGSHRHRLIEAGKKVGQKLIGLVESSTLKARSREARKMLQYALALFAKARASDLVAKLCLRYTEACEKYVESAAAPAYEPRDFQVPKSLPAPRPNRKAVMAKQRAKLVREVQNFATSLMLADEDGKVKDLAALHVKQLMDKRADELASRAS